LEHAGRSTGVILCENLQVQVSGDVFGLKIELLGTFQRNSLGYLRLKQVKFGSFTAFCTVGEDRYQIYLTRHINRIYSKPYKLLAILEITFTHPLSEPSPSSKSWINVAQTFPSNFLCKVQGTLQRFETFY
jgi:hypothetical protein